jgi:uncharacterized membrane-anchored protein
MTTKSSKPNIVLLITAIAVQLLLFLMLFLTNFIVVADSQEIALKLQPVDPRDPFRGDYLVLNYDINTIETSSYNNSETFKQGDTVYIGLNLAAPQYGSKVPNAYFAYNTIYANKPELNSNSGNYSLDQNSNATFFLKGTVESATLYDRNANYDSTYNNSYTSYDQKDKYSIKYGIEQYFIPEGTGNRSELNNSDAYGIAKVNRNTGEARLDRVEINGKKWPK